MLGDKFEQIVQRMFPGSKLRRTWQLQGGISMGMTGLEAVLRDGGTKKMIVRQPSARYVASNPNVASDEFRLLQIAKSAGLTVPTAYYLDESGEILAGPYFVLEYIEGRPEFGTTEWPVMVRHMATELSKIHSIDLADFDVSFLPQGVHGISDTFSVRPAKIDDSLEEGRIRDALERVWPLPGPNREVLLHGDFWSANIIWRDGQLVGVIDWEDAATGDPLIDIAITRLDMLWAFGAEAMNDFTDQYRALTDIDFANLPYWDLYSALRPAFSIGEWASGWSDPPILRNDVTEQTMREGHKWFVSQAFDKLPEL